MSSTTSGSPGFSPTQYQVVSSPWQDKLQSHCSQWRLNAPVFNIISDRRGGRTAWSAVIGVLIGGQFHRIQARYWYDGQYINNAREDAAEVVLQRLNGIVSPPTPTHALLCTAPGNIYRPN